MANAQTSTEMIVMVRALISGLLVVVASDLASL
jgi:hypothetical protein